jgi:hypothetical protein
MFEDKIHTQRDKTFSAHSTPPSLKQPSMRTPRMGGGSRRGFMVSSLWKSMNSEIVLIVERPLYTTGPAT